MLLRHYYRDRPKLKVEPIHPDAYQWWFRLPDGTWEGNVRRRWGFLLYMAISNAGLRDVAMDSWRLFVTSTNKQKHELRSLTIQNPIFNLPGGGAKVFAVLGTTGLVGGETMVPSGASIVGFAYYTYACYGDPQWDPDFQTDGTVHVTFRVTGVLGRATKCAVILKEKPLSEIQEMADGIADLDAD